MRIGAMKREGRGCEKRDKDEEEEEEKKRRKK